MKKRNIVVCTFATLLTITSGTLAFASNDGFTLIQDEALFKDVPAGEVHTFEDGSKRLKQVQVFEDGIHAESGIYVVPGAELSDEALLESSHGELVLGELQYEGTISVPADGTTITGFFPIND